MTPCENRTHETESEDTEPSGADTLVIAIGTSHIEAVRRFIRVVTTVVIIVTPPHKRDAFVISACKLVIHTFSIICKEKSTHDPQGFDPGLAS